MNVFLRRSGNTFLAETPAEIAKIQRCGTDEVVVAKITRNRNIKHHRKLFAVMRMVAHNWPGPEKLNEDEVLLRLKATVGWTDDVKDFRGNVRTVLRSISFAECDQGEFETFYNLAIPALATALGISPHELDENYSDYL